MSSMSPPPSPTGGSGKRSSKGKARCPLADLHAAVDHSAARAVCPFHAHADAVASSRPLHRGAAPGPSRDVSDGDTLLKSIGGGDKIREMCTRYAREGAAACVCVCARDCARAYAFAWRG
jgi:hypothetical protein